ncbi:MAG: hypothetical protein BalsKO_24330 [Balneolaceae bacterium]
MGRSRYKVLDELYPYFITSSIVGKLPLLLDAELRSIIIEGFRFLIEKRNLKMYAYVIMPDHIHCLMEGKDLAKHISSFKSFTARRIIDYLKNQKSNTELLALRNAKLAHKKDREYQVWTEGFHPKQIISDKMMEQKISYIHYNPVRAGLATKELDWENSSAGFYSGKSSKLSLTLFGDWGAPTQSIGANEPANPLLGQASAWAIKIKRPFLIFSFNTVRFIFTLN